MPAARVPARGRQLADQASYRLLQALRHLFALETAEKAGATELASLIRQALKILNVADPTNRAARQEALQRLETEDFEQMDDAYLALEAIQRSRKTKYRNSPRAPCTSRTRDAVHHREGRPVPLTRLRQAHRLKATPLLRCRITLFLDQERCRWGARHRALRWDARPARTRRVPKHQD
jgi:hypothetical protein